jgi:hypothetical protein
MCEHTKTKIFRGELTPLRAASKLLKLRCRGSSLVERRPEKAGVASSILAPGTTIAATGSSIPKPIPDLFETSAAILFLHNESGQLSEIGELGSHSELASDDKCRASCVDWYGNARPLFVRGLIIALLGYELVEGNVQDDHVTEMRRVSFAPKRSQVADAASK